MELKQYGCKLYEIKELMENRNSQKLKAMLQDRHAKLSIEINRLMNTSIILEKRISEIIKEEACKMNSGKILIVNEVYKIFSNRVSAEFSGEFVVIGR